MLQSLLMGSKRELVMKCQDDIFKDEIQALKKGKELSQNHALVCLSPLVDNTGLLRVGGRLQHAAIPADVKRPILLPKAHPVTALVVQNEHEKVRHQGRHLTLGALRCEGFHVQNSNAVIKSILSQCELCRKLRGSLCTQLMANLPEKRVEEVAPFTHTGVDLFGPFSVHEGKSTRRNNSTKNEYAVIFVCFVSRAIHVEPCPSLDASSFRNALERFMSIRGTCRTLRSDNGSNLVCTSKQVQALDLEAVQRGLSVKGISWQFNPPGASHFGGFYERKIGAMRRILEATCDLAVNHQLSRDEFHTLLQQSAAIVNNTPLWGVSSSPDDPAPLTPVALLTMKEEPADINIDSFTEKDLMAYGTRRWRRTQYLADEFFKRWRTYYLQDLQQRNKWHKRKDQVNVGDVVIVRDKNLPRNSWP